MKHKSVQHELVPYPSVTASVLLPLTLLAACSSGTPTPMMTTVCELSAHAQQLVQIQAELSVQSDGDTVIGDAHCATTKIALRLSQAATRAGAAERLTAASQTGARDGRSSIPATLTGVYWRDSTGAYFVAESVSGI